MIRRNEFLTDGVGAVRELPLHPVPGSEQWSARFRVTMRLAVMGQMTEGLAAESRPVSKPGEDEDGRLDVTAVDKQPDSLRWPLRDGNGYRTGRSSRIWSGTSSRRMSHPSG